jgi:hypothetical protein
VQQQTLIQLSTDSKQYLIKVWPRLATGNAAQPVQQVDWNGNNIIDKAPTVLEGQQCLVLFLGGARASSGAFIGFSTDGTKPMDTTNPTRKGPYFQFDVARVQPQNSFPQQYVDPYGTAYAYFSSGKGANLYDVYTGLGSHDCPSLGNIQPYFQQGGANPAKQFYNPDTFQIISAGKDQKYGPGGLWVSTMGTGGMATAGALTGADDLTNFYDAKLGVSP